MFVNRCLRRILGIRWPEVIRNTELWSRTGQKPIDEEIRRRKWNWVGHTLRKRQGAIERAALDWNPQGARRRGRPKITWRRSVATEVENTGWTWNEVKALARDRDGWRGFVEALCSNRRYRT